MNENTNIPTKLVGNEQLKHAGDFIRNSLVMGKDQDFSAVSEIWLKKTISYEDGLQKLAEGKARTTDILAPIGHMTPDVQGGRFCLTYHDGRTFFPTKWAISQMGNISKCGTWYVGSLLENPKNVKEEDIFVRDEEDAETLAHVIYNGFRRIDPDKPFLFRTRQDGSLRAMLSEKYAEVNNDWFLETLKRILPGGRLSHWKGDEDTIWGNVLIPDSIRSEEDSDYGAMVSVSNSEIGERRVSTLPSIFRSICMNGCIWGQKKGEAIKQVHRGEIDLNELFNRIKINLELQIPLIPQKVELFLNTKNFMYNALSMKPIFAQLAIEESISKKNASAVLKAYGKEPGKSLFSVVNAITRAGQTLGNAEWVNFDSIGGKLVEGGEEGWNRLTKRANELKVKEVENAFANAA